MAATNVTECENWMEKQQYESMALKKSKAPRKEKILKHIVESLHLTTMVVSYICHFVTYSTSKKQVT
jgi:hypothetical protein